MQKKTLKVCNQKGLHARAAAKLSSKVADFQSHVMIRFNDNTVEADSVIQLMLLAAPFASEIEILIEGKDELEAMTAIAQLINCGFEEN